MIDGLGIEMDYFDKWIAEYCKCKTCIHAVEVELFRGVLCKHPEIDDGLGWLPPDSLCEAHSFNDPMLESELKRMQDDWYESEYGSVMPN